MPDKYPSAHFRLEDIYQDAINQLAVKWTGRDGETVSKTDVVREMTRRIFLEEFGQRKAAKLFEELR